MGKPKLYVKSVHINLWAELLNAIEKRAARKHTTNSAIIRELLVKALKMEDDEGRAGKAKQA